MMQEFDQRELSGLQGGMVQAMDELALVWENRHPGEQFFPEESR